MTLGQGIEALKEGKAICREGWNGRGMFIYLIEGHTRPVTEKESKLFATTFVICNPYMVLKGVDGKISSWVPSSTDALAEDYMIYEVK